MADGGHLYRTDWSLTPITDERRRRPQAFPYDACWVVDAHVARDLEKEVIRLRELLQEANYAGL